MNLQDFIDNPPPIFKEEPKQQPVGLQSFVAHQLLGSGSFGDVFLVEKKDSADFYAMKVLQKSKVLAHNLKRYAITERNILSSIDHPFIVKARYAF